MKEDIQCIICTDIIEDYRRDPAHNFDLVYIKCPRCNAYGYYKEHKGAIEALSIDKRKELLENAKNSNNDKRKTPIIDLLR